MEIIVLYDNRANKGFKEGWGLSILIKLNDELILFDTGADRETLEFNSNLLGIDKEKIKWCFISHLHHDHIGGLDWLSKKTFIFLPGEYKNNIKGIRSFVFEFPIKEQALMIEKFKVMFVGCSHPGIVSMTREVYKKYGKLRLIIGGFHLLSITESRIRMIAKELKIMSEGIAPCHCTGEKAIKIFKKEFGKKFIEVKAGSVIKI